MTVQGWVAPGAFRGRSWQRWQQLGGSTHCWYIPMHILTYAKTSGAVPEVTTP
jgi:hypothetical protein